MAGPVLEEPPLEELSGILPPGALLTEPASIEAYRTDWSRDPAAGLPCAVVRPQVASEVQAVLRWASRYGVPVVPRGAGTGLSGGTTAVDGGLVLSLERMRAVRVDPLARVAEVEPGALNVDVKTAAAAHGLWYPPDPSSYDICSIGGNIATNAGGLCCVKYGVTTDYVLGLDVVLADGTLVTLGGRNIKDVAGLSLVKLFVGSEGTLGVITRAILRLLPPQPPRATLVATFPTVRSAAGAVVAIGRTLRPCLLELMDRTSVNAVEDLRPMGLDRRAGALLLAQTDAPGAARATDLAALVAACEEAGASEIWDTDDPGEAELFVAARRAAFPAFEARGVLFLEDVGVPVPLLPDLLDGIAAVAARHRVEIPVVAHAGDGNTHPTIIIERGDPAAAERAQAAFAEIMAVALSLGGTITGEHGVGRAKRAALPDQLGPGVMDLTRRIKTALDPAGILNPGAILPPAPTTGAAQPPGRYDAEHAPSEPLETRL